MTAKKKTQHTASTKVPAVGKKAVTQLKKDILAHAKKRRMILIGVVAVLALLLALGFFALGFSSDFTVGLIDLPAKTEKALTEEIRQYALDQDIKVRFVQGRTGDLSLFAPSAKTESLYTDFANLEDALLYLAAPSVLQAAKAPKALPLLTDHLEFFSADRTLPTDRKNPLYPDQLSAFLLAPGSKTYALALEGTNDGLLVDILGHLVASQSGREAYETLRKELVSRTAFDTLSAPGMPLSAALSWLKHLYTAKALHPNWYDLGPADQAGLFAQGQFAHGVLYLSAHRELPRSALDAGSDGRFLSQGADGQEIATTPIYAGALRKDAKGNTKAAAQAKTLLSFLASPETQERLASASGLAPANLQARAPDLQARNARNWISSSQVYLGLSREGFTDDKSLKAFASAAREYIRFSK